MRAKAMRITTLISRIQTLGGNGPDRGDQHAGVADPGRQGEGERLADMVLGQPRPNPGRLLCGFGALATHGHAGVDALRNRRDVPATGAASPPSSYSLADIKPGGNARHAYWKSSPVPCRACA